MIAGPYPEDLRIVTSWAGPQTGDSYYRTEDGRVWVTTLQTPTITGVNYGSVVGNRIISPPRSSTYWPRRAPVVSRPASPLPDAEERVEPPRPGRAPKTILTPPVSFVGAGPMHRRWR